MNYYIKEFRRRCRLIDRDTQPRPQPLPKQITSDVFSHYEIVKRSGDGSKTVAVGLTLQDATTLMKCLHSRLTRLPLNEDGSPLFELELYEMTIAGRKRYYEAMLPRFDADTKWIG